MAFTFSFGISLWMIVCCARNGQSRCAQSLHNTNYSLLSNAYNRLRHFGAVGSDKVRPTWQKRFKANFSCRKNKHTHTHPTLIDGDGGAHRNVKDLQSSKSHIDYLLYECIESVVLKIAARYIIAAKLLRSIEVRARAHAGLMPWGRGEREWERKQEKKLKERLTYGRQRILRKSHEANEKRRKNNKNENWSDAKHSHPFRKLMCFVWFRIQNIFLYIYRIGSCVHVNGLLLWMHWSHFRFGLENEHINIIIISGD